ncbi:unnamed protein product [Thelazia callipaeda]|uniref:Kazal-like domain-containing protein n=1 Tax=Thelazia callipaeda TaxID=103827 RepID=A0A0N5DCF7_THECL|nr:unnamed protein product [Thelazia callipaeda]
MLNRCVGLREPICDSNGRWHRNKCTFLWARCMAAREGQRLSISDGQLCMKRSLIRGNENGTNFAASFMNSHASRHCHRQCSDDLIYEPVCATTFVTYSNRCLFQNAKCRDKRECKECMAFKCDQAEEENELDSNFLCDQAGQTKRKCEFEMLRCIYERKFGFNITPAYEGRCCPSEDTCLLDRKNAQPVCDSRNLYQCRTKKIAHLKVTLQNENGSCAITHSKIDQYFPEGMECDSGFECDSGYDPVCGTDGLTYINRCRIDKAKCYNKSLSVAYSGECCVFQCEKHYAPVCDNRNITHDNLCVFSVQNCLATRRGSEPLHVRTFTACREKKCDSLSCDLNNYEPVCASNGFLNI